MPKLKSAAKIIITLLILLNSSLVGISLLPTTSFEANASLATDIPVVYVSPQNATANVGETVTISVNVFNLSNNFHSSNDAWELGDPLPPLVPAGGRYNYSLGNLYGFYIVFSWDPTVLEYVTHNARVPVETYSDGILHEPIIDAQDEVDEAAGTYSIAKSSQSPAAAFNSPGADATVFNMTFEVKKRGKCTLSIDEAELAVDRRMPNLFYEVPHWITSGEFRTGELLTRIESVKAGALVDGELYDPVISGEDVMVDVAVRNDGEIIDTYNLSIYDESLLRSWENETLTPDESKAFNYTLEDVGIGTHTVTVNATILHGNDTFVDELSDVFLVIGAPVLEVQGPSSATAGDSVSFSASGSSHSDPNGEILNYTWTLTAPGETGSRDTQDGQDVTFDLGRAWPGGNWTVALEVRDNYGIEYNNIRPATDSYRRELLLQVSEAPPPTFFTIENIALIVILVVIIAAAVIYLRRRSR